MDGPVFANHEGGWMSLTNMRRSLRAALPADLSWMTPHSLRRTVATVVRDARGPAVVATESIRKVPDFGRVADLQAYGHLDCQRFLRARRDSNSQPSDP
jgi:hypothetical protein